MSRVQWAEVDFDPPPGAIRLLTPQPADGKTYVMYHGTTQAKAQSILASGFRQSKDGMLGRGVYLSRDLEKASRYPIGHPDEDKVVIRSSVNVGKVKRIDHQKHPMQKTWHDRGYDTAWVPPNCGMVSSGLEENCVWDPRRIIIFDLIKPTVVSNVSGGYIGRKRFRFHSETDANTGIYTNMFMPLWYDIHLNSFGEFYLNNQQAADGWIYTMYHGTTQASAQSILASSFRQSEDGMLGRGVYLSRDVRKASRYPIGHPEWDKVVIKVKVNVGKVIAITQQNHPLQKTWHDHGYDTAWVPPNCGMTESGLEEDCVWDPRRIVILGVIYPCMVPVQLGYPGCSYGYM
ncbi:uncharacterized protein LOC106958709 [Poecilia latipinna]|uniref:uncharacterized protein LOC106958709 n=1 Tax=Poecilia latipinna TaxID=48699 RepID=UPI00072E80A0|nr:PREDICTED: uncharacterized protein LOC106958709 [Poecilia latipinna]